VIFATWSYVPLITANVLLAEESSTNTTQSDLPSEDRSCNYRLAIPVLNDPSGLGAAPKNIIMGINDTAIILYETSHRVYAIANHRMSNGFRRLHDTFSAADNETAHAALREANADLILTCKFAPDMVIHKKTEGSPNFHERLADGAVPEFLEPIPLPEGAENLLFFQVQPVSEIN
jgi:hypothetical protein